VAIPVQRPYPAVHLPERMLSATCSQRPPIMWSPRHSSTVRLRTSFRTSCRVRPGPRRAKARRRPSSSASRNSGAFSRHRLLEPIGYTPPAEAEANNWR